uniref:Uncharacterized protein n=1 Tax=Physcomitrium patens TaxID=3218 RepID=A0A2K1KNX5_PHYPA|nr:hypothetical protein PHYPA_006358 [Physcomitrium patens]PNR55463.1 hypothetical protein PHYPA_006360 [Physcomitrium patens]
MSGLLSAAKAVCAETMFIISEPGFVGLCFWIVTRMNWPHSLPAPKRDGLVLSWRVRFLKTLLALNKNARS